MRLIIAQYRSKGRKEREAHRRDLEEKRVSPKRRAERAIFHTSFCSCSRRALWRRTPDPAAIRMLRKARETKRSEHEWQTRDFQSVTNVSFRKTCAFPAATMASRQNNWDALVCVLRPPRNAVRLLRRFPADERTRDRWLSLYGLAVVSRGSGISVERIHGRSNSGYEELIIKPATTNLCAIRLPFLQMNRQRCGQNLSASRWWKAAENDMSAMWKAGKVNASIKRA